jgi:mono/diheme cytochrome c family protein
MMTRGRVTSPRPAVVSGLVAALWAGAAAGAEIPAGARGFESGIKPFFETNCVSCHGPEKKKGKVVLHTLDGGLSGAGNLELWQSILDMVEGGEMPPDDEPQPADEERAAVVKWIEAELRRQSAEVAHEPAPAVTRRLTNFEYQNTMRDLLGIDLKLISGLPEDPVKPYKFNNNAGLMRIGPEQIDRYLETARRAMASAIVDPGKPVVHTTRQEWQPTGLDRGLGNDEVGLWGNRRHTPAWGMGLKGFPETGEYRIRIKASAILPPGVQETQLRLVMGYELNENSSTLRVEPVGSVRLRNSPDQPEVFEFRGRIENHPARPGVAKGGQPQPATMAITPQVLYDDGTLNDGERNLKMPRVVIEWMEFESPVTEVWPPAHHTRILFDSPLRESDPPAYVAAVLRRFMTRAYRRPATDEEVDRFVRIHGMISPDMATMEAAMRETLAMVLVSPEFLFHTVPDDPADRRHAFASKLSYFLWGSMPDEELVQVAASGKLDDPEVIGEQVRRLLADPRSADFVRNFTMQWLSLEKSRTVPINRDLFPRFLYYVPLGERAGTETPYLPTIRDHMIDETVGFIGELIRRNASVLNVVDSDFAYLNQPLAAHYGIAGVEGNELRPVAIQPEDHLGGLLTHGSVLIGNGTGSAPHPIYRAVWLREAILGDEVKPPPADVPALTDTAGESAEHATSIKDLLALHRTKESCNDCHFRLDPWGIPFEHYNAIGKYQPLVPKSGSRIQPFDKRQHADLKAYMAYLNTVNTVEVEADTRLPNGPEVNGMADLKRYLLKDRKEDIAANLVRRFLTYGLGRELTYRDREAVEQLLDYLRMNGLGMQDMIVAVCQSPLFRETDSQPSKQQ